MKTKIIAGSVAAKVGKKTVAAGSEAEFSGAFIATGLDERTQVVVTTEGQWARVRTTYLGGQHMTVELPPNCERHFMGGGIVPVVEINAEEYEPAPMEQPNSSPEDTARDEAMLAAHMARIADARAAMRFRIPINEGE